MSLVVIAMVALLGSGAVALVVGRWPRFALGTGAAGAVVAAGLALPPALRALRGQLTTTLTAPWPVPGGELSVGLDPLSAFFLVPLLVLGAVCAIYGVSYMQIYKGRRRLGPPAFFFNVTLAAMVLVLVARHALLFLVAWEVMTLASYLLVTFDDEEAAVRRAGWVYLVAGHVGVAFLVGPRGGPGSRNGVEPMAGERGAQRCPWRALRRRLRGVGRERIVGRVAARRRQRRGRFRERAGWRPSPVRNRRTLAGSQTGGRARASRGRRGPRAGSVRPAKARRSQRRRALE